MPSSLKQLHDFSLLINQLKLIERYNGQFYWRDYPTPSRWESVADHSWRLSVLVLLFANRLSRPFNVEKALKMALVHDLPEIIAGDASPLGETGTGSDSHAFNKEVQAKRHVDEKSAAKTIFAKLDSPDGSQLYEAWLETETLASFEARVVKALDKIEAMTQVLEWRNGHMFKEHLEFTLKYGKKGANVDPAIAEYAAYVAALMQQRYRKFKKTTNKTKK